METERIIGAEDAMVVADVVFPLLKLVDEMHARAQKYRDKRLSSRLKRLLCRMARKEVRTMDESKKAIKVSVIVPVYNAERYLRQALDSLAAQTLSDVEFICIDDGSRDASGAILDEYFAKDRRFRVFHTVNQGAANARNFGMAQACGEYLTFMDADDYVEPFWLEEVYGISKKNKLDICISDFDFQYFMSFKEHFKFDFEASEILGLPKIAHKYKKRTGVFVGILLFSLIILASLLRSLRSFTLSSSI